MDAKATVDRQEVDKVKLFKETARVVVIDDRCGTLMDPGDMSRAMCAAWAKSAILFHVKDIQGSSSEEKIADIGRKVMAAVGPDSSSLIFVLDRDLGIGNLPLSGDAKKSVAATIDNYNDGPALVPFIKKWFNDAPIFAAKGDFESLFSGTIADTDGDV